MRWDEDVYGREYDLDLYMIVAVDDFNMGAMENKGFNVFNTKYVLANAANRHRRRLPRDRRRHCARVFSQLDRQPRHLPRLVSTEPEGRPDRVSRPGVFSADMFSRAIQRIGDVRILRNHQFSEDAGPMAHPVRPASYQEINNFYTATVYNKGAEVVRMMHCLLGADNFRRGMDLYFERHDGEAVTTDDFRAAMQDASGIDLERFQRWYEQSGTPRIDIRRSQDAATRSPDLDIRQQAGTTRGELNRPFHMPMRLALFDPTGRRWRSTPDGNSSRYSIFETIRPGSNLPIMPPGTMISAFRGFSAPVI